MKSLVMLTALMMLCGMLVACAGEVRYEPTFSEHSADVRKQETPTRHEVPLPGTEPVDAGNTDNVGSTDNSASATVEEAPEYLYFSYELAGGNSNGKKININMRIIKQGLEGIKNLNKLELCLTKKTHDNDPYEFSRLNTINKIGIQSGYTTKKTYDNGSGKWEVSGYGWTYDSSLGREGVALRHLRYRTWSGSDGRAHMSIGYIRIVLMHQLRENEGFGQHIYHYSDGTGSAPDKPQGKQLDFERNQACFPDS